MERIKGVSSTAVINGRKVVVVFRSPYRWRIYDGAADVTKKFGHKLRGDPLPRHTPEWDAWHAAVKAGTTEQRIW